MILLLSDRFCFIFVAKMETYLIVEAVSVLLNLAFLALLIKRSKWCWPFGIIGSSLGILLFIAPGAEVKLYSEAILYSYYIWIGVYGWYKWEEEKDDVEILSWTLRQNAIAFAIGLFSFPVLGYLMDTYFDSNSPYLDALTTSFSFMASYMQARRVLTSWHFWLVINAVSIYLYLNRGLNLYAGLMVVYFVFSLYGLYQWRKSAVKP